jgi:hypothetical protein
MTLDRNMKWDAQYKLMCMKYLNMNHVQAEAHFRSAPDFDRGYSPFWYITEELNCQFVERKPK